MVFHRKPTYDVYPSIVPPCHEYAHVQPDDPLAGPGW